MQIDDFGNENKYSLHFIFVEAVLKITAFITSHFIVRVGTIKYALLSVWRGRYTSTVSLESIPNSV